MLQGRLHRAERGKLLVEFRDVRLGERLHLPARSTPVLPQTEQFADLLDREPQVAGVADEAQRVMSLSAYWR